MQFKRTLLSTAISTSLGAATLGAPPVCADTLTISWSGAWTGLTSVGDSLNNPDTSGTPYYKGRTPVSGTMTFDTDTGTGTMTIAPYSYFDSGNAVATGVNLVSIGDGFGNPGNLVLGNMGWNWNGNIGVPLNLVWDAQGLFSVLSNNFTGPLSCTNVTNSQTISGIGALAATESTTFGDAMNNYTLPLGPSPVVTTTWNTTNVGSPTLGTNPSGTLPLIVDSIGGSPFPNGFSWFANNHNIDITDMHIDSCVPTGAFSGSVRNIWADVPLLIFSTGDTTELGDWVTLSNEPAEWIRIRNPMAFVALTTLRSSGESVVIEAHPFGQTTIFQDMDTLSISGNGGSAPDNVTELFFTANDNTQTTDPYGFATISQPNSLPGGGLILMSTEQAAVAAEAYASQESVNYTLGTVFVYNTVTKTLDEIGNATAAISIEP